MAHVPLQLTQGDVSDREGVPSCPGAFKHFLGVCACVYICNKSHRAAFSQCGGPSADRGRKKGAIKSNGTRCIYVFLMGTRGKVSGKKMMDSSSQ